MDVFEVVAGRLAPISHPGMCIAHDSAEFIRWGAQSSR